tara:strand:- start:829 stop:1740 length:912 start_codon:yes stop_codon:yes gene_type:complete
MINQNCLRENNKLRKNNIICGNCGKKGHTYKYCKEPIISLGAILFKLQETDNEVIPLFLMICRKDTFGYVEFMRGKYKEYNQKYIQNLFEEMTVNERDKLISNIHFDTLWSELWLKNNNSPSDENEQYRTEYERSKNRFYRIKEGIDCPKINTYYNNLHQKWHEPEWGFPKGRRNLRENDYNCAIRELTEETGLNTLQFDILENVRPVEEVFIGTNNVRYKHIYYIGKCKSDLEVNINNTNQTQITEVSQIKWFTYKDALAKIRDYNSEKKKVLTQAYNIINNFFTKFNDNDTPVNNCKKILI